LDLGIYISDRFDLFAVVLHDCLPHWVRLTVEVAGKAVTPEGRKSKSVYLMVLKHAPVLLFAREVATIDVMHSKVRRGKTRPHHRRYYFQAL